MTDTEKLKWAVGVLNREAWRHSDKWTADFPKAYRIAEDGGGVPPVLFASEAIAIALALDEQARRKLPMSEQAEWAAAELASRVSSCAPWRASLAQGRWFCSDRFGRVRWAKEAIAIAESLVRREMLGDTSDSRSKEVGI